MNSIVRYLFLLFTLGIASCYISEDSNFIGHKKPLYLVFNNDKVERKILTSTLDLQPVYLCAQDIRKKYHPKSENLDFEVFAKKYVECFAQKILKGNHEWTSLYGERSELKHHKYSGLYVHMLMNDVEFSKETPVSTHVDISVRNVVYNANSSAEVTNKVQESVEKISSVTTSSKHSWKTSGSVEVGVTEPITKCCSASVKFSMFSGGSQGSEKSDSDSIKYFISDASTVPAHSNGRLVWTKTVSNMKMDWKAYIQVSGWIGTKVSGKIYFLPVVDMIYVYDEYLTRLDLNTLGMLTSGEMQMTDAVISDAVIDEYTKEITKEGEAKCPHALSNILMYPLKVQTASKSS